MTSPLIRARLLGPTAFTLKAVRVKMASTATTIRLFIGKLACADFLKAVHELIV